MPIVVEHALPATALGKLAFETGAGIREQKLIERTRDDFWRGQEFALKAAQMAQQNQLQQMAFQERQLAREATLQEAQQRAVDLAHTEIEDSLVSFEKQAARQQFTPEGQRIFRDLGSKWAGIQKNRPRLTTQQYRQVLQQFRGEMAAARLGNHVMEQPSVEEMVKERVFPLPDGSGSWVRQPDGSLEFKTHRDWQSELFAKMLDKAAERKNRLELESMRQEVKKAGAAKQEAKAINAESDKAETAFRLATSTYLEMRNRREEAAAKAAAAMSKADADFVKAWDDLRDNFVLPPELKDTAAGDKGSKSFQFPPDSVEAAKLNALVATRDAAKAAAQARIDKANQDAQLAQAEWERANQTIQAVRAKRQAWDAKQAAEEAAAQAAAVPSVPPAPPAPGVAAPGGHPANILPGDMPEGPLPVQQLQGPPDDRPVGKDVNGQVVTVGDVKQRLWQLRALQAQQGQLTPEQVEEGRRLLALVNGPAESALPVVANDADYRALPSGTRFRAPDGTVRQKP